MMKTTFKRGFTLIELLVVIAIIGILASVVLASLNSARDKGADAAIKANLNSVRAQAELVYDTASPHSYAGVCADANVAAADAAAENTNGAGNVVCTNSASAWMMASDLVGDTGDYYCVDNTGAASQATGDVVDAGSGGAINTGTTACP